MGYDNIFSHLRAIFPEFFLCKIVLFSLKIFSLDDVALYNLIRYSIILYHVIEEDSEICFALGESSGDEVLTQFTKLPFFIVFTQLIMADVIRVPLGSLERVLILLGRVRASLLRR